MGDGKPGDGPKIAAPGRGDRERERYWPEAAVPGRGGRSRGLLLYGAALGIGEGVCDRGPDLPTGGRGDALRE